MRDGRKWKMLEDPSERRGTSGKGHAGRMKESKALHGIPECAGERGPRGVTRRMCEMRGVRSFRNSHPPPQIRYV